MGAVKKPKTKKRFQTKKRYLKKRKPKPKTRNGFMLALKKARNIKASTFKYKGNMYRMLTRGWLSYPKKM